MPKIQVYVSEALKDLLDERGIRSTLVCQEALEAAVEEPTSVASKAKHIRRLLREIEDQVAQN